MHWTASLWVYRQAVAAGEWQRSHFYGVLKETLPQDLYGCTLARLAEQLLSTVEAFVAGQPVKIVS